jgi:outer membrane biosynthesis protein TonB
MAGRKNRYVSNKGRTVDWERLRAANEKTVAAGNARMNARGDILGEGGQVLRSREQIDAETARAEQAHQHQNPGQQSQNISIKRDAIPKRKAAEKYAAQESKDITETVTPQEALEQARERKRQSTKHKEEKPAMSAEEAAEQLKSQSTQNKSSSTGEDSEESSKSSKSTSSNKSSGSKSSGSSRKIVDSDD